MKPALTLSSDYAGADSKMARSCRDSALRKPLAALCRKCSLDLHSMAISGRVQAVWMLPGYSLAFRSAASAWLRIHPIVTSCPKTLRLQALVFLG